MSKIALIFGISGQDGSYLAKYLIKKNYLVFGTSRRSKKIPNHSKLNISNKVKIAKLNPKNLKAVKNITNKINPDEIYYLSGISSIFESNENPKETFESITIGTINVLEAIKSNKNKKIKAFFAGSTECFGNLKTNQKYFNENSAFNPENIYSYAKLSSYYLVKRYRESDGIFCCTGILANHESSLRSSKYISKKIIEGAKNIFKKKQKKIILGNINISRDWGWAPEYVEIFWNILKLKNPDDYIIASGETTSLREFIKLVFEKFDLNWKDHIQYSDNLKRKSDIKFTKFNTKKIFKVLNWKTKYKINDIVEKMINDEY